MLRRDCGLVSTAHIADIAAGTGLLAELFLNNGNPVTAIEPNGPMRAFCQSLKAQHANLDCRDGMAEATGLPARSVDFVSVGQAMHWFDLPRARAEFARILRTGGWCVVVYNNRPVTSSDFHDRYEQLLLDYGIDYHAVRSQYLDRAALSRFFSPATMQQAILPNMQELDLEGLIGRVLSSSYMPQREHERFPAMLNRIHQLFERHAVSGRVRMEYECVVSYGRLT